MKILEGQLYAGGPPNKFAVPLIAIGGASGMLGFIGIALAFGGYPIGERIMGIAAFPGFLCLFFLWLGVMFAGGGG